MGRLVEEKVLLGVWLVDDGLVGGWMEVLEEWMDELIGVGIDGWVDETRAGDLGHVGVDNGDVDGDDGLLDSFFFPSIPSSGIFTFNAATSCCRSV